MDDKASAHCMKTNSTELDKNLLTFQNKSSIQICEVEIRRFFKAHLVSQQAYTI
jgi:hypothetical protein